jgi:hypothetical protein
MTWQATSCRPYAEAIANQRAAEAAALARVSAASQAETEARLNASNADTLMLAAVVGHCIADVARHVIGCRLTSRNAV